MRKQLQKKQTSNDAYPSVAHLTSDHRQALERHRVRKQRIHEAVPGACDDGRVGELLLQNGKILNGCDEKSCSLVIMKKLNVWAGEGKGLLCVVVCVFVMCMCLSVCVYMGACMRA